MPSDVANGDSLLEVASLIYFASMAAAFVRYEQWITSSGADVLRYGFKRMLDWRRTTPALRQLFQAGLDKIGEG